MKNKLKSLFSSVLAAAMVCNVFTFVPAKAQSVLSEGFYYGFNSESDLPERMYAWTDINLASSGATMRYSGDVEYVGICDASADDPINKKKGDLAIKMTVTPKKQERRLDITVPLAQKLEKGDIYTFSFEAYVQNGGNTNYGKSIQSSLETKSGAVDNQRFSYAMQNGSAWTGNMSIRDFGRGDCYFCGGYDTYDYTAHSPKFVRYEYVIDTEDEEYDGEQTLALYVRDENCKAVKQAFKASFAQLDSSSSPVSDLVSEVTTAKVSVVVADNGESGTDSFAIDNISSSVYHLATAKKTAVYADASKDSGSIVTYATSDASASAERTGKTAEGDEITFNANDGKSAVAYRSWADDIGAGTANLSKIPSDAYVIADICIPENEDLSKYSLVIADKPDTANDFAASAVGVALAPYYTTAGKLQRVRIPFSAFGASATVFANSEIPYTDTNMFYTAGIGIACTGTSGKAILGDMYIAGKIAAPESFDVGSMRSGEIDLEWSPSANEVAGYEIYRDGALIGEVDGGENSYTDLNLESNRYYNYSLKAKSLCGEYSDEVELNDVYMSVLGTPQNFILENVGGSELAVNISWDEASYGAPSKYVIWRNGVKLTELGNDARSYTDTDVEQNTYYEYEIAAATADDEFSLKASGNVLAAYVYAPENLRYVGKSGNGATILWNDAQFAENYNVYVNGELVQTTAETSIDADSVLKINDISKIEVSALTAEENESLMSESIKVYPKDESLVSKYVFFDDSIPTGVTASASGVTYDKAYTKSTGMGSAAVKISFNAVSQGSFTLQFNKSFGSNTLLYGGRIMLGVYIPQDADLDALSAGLSYTPNGTYATKAVFAVPLADYVSEKGRWTVAEIPISDLPKTAEYRADSKRKFAKLDTSLITGITIIGDYSKTDFADEIIIDEVYVAQYEGGSADVTDSTGNPVDVMNKLKTDDCLVIKTGNSVVPTGASVSLKKNGMAVEAYAVPTENGIKVVPVNGFEPNESYTLDYSNFVNENGAVLSGSISFRTDDTQPQEQKSKIDALELSANDARVGGTVTAKLKINSFVLSKDGEYDVEINITGDKDRLSVSDAKPVFNEVLKDALYTDTASAVTVKGKLTFPQSADDLVTLGFTADKSGEATLTVDAKITSEDTAIEFETATATAQITLPNQDSGTSGGGSGGKTSGGSSGNYGGGRPTVTPTVPDNTANDETFTDLGKNHWAYDYVNSLADENIINGYEDGSFRPDDYVTREDFIVLIDRAVAIATGDEVTFSDISESDYFADSVSKATSKEIVLGRPDGSFGVGESITRQDMCVIVARAAKYKGIANGIYDYADFTDSDKIADYALDSVVLLRKMGIINGVENGEFMPQSFVTRAQAAKVIYMLKSL